jgi:hypothetical protein
MKKPVIERLSINKKMIKNLHEFVLEGEKKLSYFHNLMPHAGKAYLGLEKKLSEAILSSPVYALLELKLAKINDVGNDGSIRGGNHFKYRLGAIVFGHRYQLALEMSAKNNLPSLYSYIIDIENDCCLPDVLYINIAEDFSAKIVIVSDRDVLCNDVEKFVYCSDLEDVSSFLVTYFTLEVTR